MIDLSCEQALTFTEAAKTTPGRPHVCTVTRWWLRGVRGVRLETVLVGGRRFTTREALDRFFAATTAAACGETRPTTRTCKKRQREIECAERELEEAGI